MPPDLLTASETARALRIHPSTVSRLVGAGELAAVRVGRRLLVERRDLDAYIASRRHEAAAPTTEPTTTTEVFDMAAWLERQRRALREGLSASRPRKKTAARI